MKQIPLVNAVLLATALCLAACSPKVNNGGYTKQTENMALIKPGQTNKDEVLAKLGSPSSQSSFGNESWYYITNRKEAYAFLKPEVVQQDVTRIDFDAAGVVSKIETYDKNSGKDFELVQRTTPTEGHTLGFFEQLLGNIGRFNHPANDTAAPGRKPGS